MEHSHINAAEKNRHRLAIVFGLTAVYMVIEFIGAYLTNSLALFADAAHMLTDVGALALALFAIWFAARPASPRESYGYYRMEVLAALVNGAVLFLIGVFVLYEAVRRFQQPPDVSPKLMIGIAGLGLVVNIISALLLRDGAAESINVHGAFLEVLADLLGSFGVIAAGLIVWLTGWRYADPLFSVAIGLFIIPRTYRLMASAIHILMEGAPDGLNIEDVKAAMLADPDVRSIHDLHIWSITSGVIALSAHVSIRPQADGDAILDRVSTLLADRFDIHHATLQCERFAHTETPYHG